jgi:hypothetical protein
MVIEYVFAIPIRVPAGAASAANNAPQLFAAEAAPAI